MITFLTSSPTGSLDQSHLVDGLDRMNHFVDNLKKYWRECAKCLMIAASPDACDQNDEMVRYFSTVVQDAGLSYSQFDILDRRNQWMLKEKITSFDVIFLGGGHVPTQNKFFEEIGLREKMKDYDGIVIGISAGTMNSADIVYAQPELPGESVDPGYQKFLIGLGLTKIQILPHYQMTKHFMLDGRRLFEDITFEDSFGNHFLVLPDGSYFLSENGEESVWGESWWLSDGEMKKICEHGEVKNIQEI